MKKIGALVLGLSSALLLSGCNLPNIFVIEEITLNMESVTIGVGETLQLSATVSPTYALNKSLGWSSNDKLIANVNSDGLVTARRVGECTITVSALDGGGATAMCEITVSSTPTTIDSLSFENLKTNYNLNDTFVKPTVYAIYSNSTRKNVTNDTQFTGYDMSKEGVQTVVATYSDGKNTASNHYNITVGSGGETIINKTKLKSNYSDFRKREPYDVSTAPNVGVANLIVIPVWFGDSESYISRANKDKVRQDIETSYFGTNEKTGWRSVKTYYEEESHGRLTVKGKVSDWYTTSNNSSYYNDGAKTNKIVKDATDWYFSKNPSESRSSYDSDGDGYLDGVLLIYGAPDYQAGRHSNTNLWAYCYWRQARDSNKTNPQPNVFFWASYDFMYDRTTAGSRAGTNYANGDCSHCNVDAHTFIHEMGHVFGLEDYYDYSGQYSPAAGFSMQDYNVGGHDPYSAMALGWVDPYIPTTSMSITINPFTTSGDVILLTPSWNAHNSPFDEYILLELYTPTGVNELDAKYTYTGYPQGPTKPGIRVWHVDSRLTAVQWDGRNMSYSTTLYTNPKGSNEYGYMLAFSNTYAGDEGRNYISVLGEDYSDYNLLQLIRNNISDTYQSSKSLSANDLFKAGDSFSMSNVKKQFVNSGLLNSNQNLGWTFTVDSCTSAGATITLTRV